MHSEVIDLNQVADGGRLHTHGVIKDLPIIVNGVTTMVDIKDTSKNHLAILRDHSCSEVMLLAIGRWDTCLLGHLKRRS